MKPHELNIYPEGTREEDEELRISLKENGQKEPCTEFEGKILDGKRRFRLMTELGKTPIVEKFHENGTTALQFVIIKNQRRNISQSQKAVVALELRDKIKSEFIKRKYTKGAGTGERSAEVVAKMFGICPQMVNYAETIRKNKPDLLKDVKNGKLAIRQAYKIVQPFKLKRKYIINDFNKNEGALSVLHKKLNEGWTIEMKMKKDAFQVHVSGDGVAPIRFQGEWSEKVVFEKFYEAINATCK